MVSSLAWRDDWLLGIGHLDSDHREMVRLFNRLVEAATRQGRPPDASVQRDACSPLDCLGSLIEHLRDHFAVEEAFLQSIGYPGVPEHKSEHALCLAELSDLQRRAKLTPMPMPRIDEQSLISMKEWLFDHIDEDRGFALYYFQQAVGASTGGRNDNPSGGRAGAGRTAQEMRVSGQRRVRAASSLNHRSRWRGFCGVVLEGATASPFRVLVPAQPGANCVKLALRSHTRRLISGSLV